MSSVPGFTDQALLEETFNSLDQWQFLTFPKIKRHTRYSLERDSAGSFLRAESNASASGLVWRGEFDPRIHHRLRWRWRVDRVFTKSDPYSKQGDDSPVRVYVVFKFDPDRATAWERLTYGTYKALYGQYPPHSSLNYIWTNKPTKARVIPNAYTDKARMIPLEQGTAKVGQWVEEDVDILADYRAAFGQDPPRKASLAVMNDSDNTGEAAVSWLDDLTLLP